MDTQVIQKQLNNNIEESYCSFEVSKLLKEKGFNIYQSTQYSQGVNKTTIYNYSERQCTLFGNLYFRPTHALAIEWLRINFNIELNAVRYTYSGGVYQGKKYMYYVCQYNEKYDHELPESNEHWILNEYKSNGYDFNSPQEAIEAVLKYVLTNLI